MGGNSAQKLLTEKERIAKAASSNKNFLPVLSSKPGIHQARNPSEGGPDSRNPIADQTLGTQGSIITSGPPRLDQNDMAQT